MKRQFSTELIEIMESISGANLRDPLLSIFGAFTFGTVTAYIDNWIFDPAVSYFALIGLIAADHVTGVYLAFKRGVFETRKAARIFWTLISHTSLLMFATQLSKGSTSLFWLNEGIFVPLVLINLISLVKNLALLGFIKKGFATFLHKKIDTYKNEIIDTVKKETEK